MTEETTVYAALPPEALVGLIEEEFARAEVAKAAHDRCRARVEALSALLEHKLGDGEAVVAPSGRAWYVDPNAALGSRGVNADALTEYREKLRPNLRPSTTPKLPTLDQIEKADKAGELPEGTNLATFIIEPPRGRKLKRRKLHGGED